MLRKVMLYGDLGKKYGRTHNLAVKSPAEAIRALEANYSGFEQALRDLDKKGLGVRIVVADKGINELDDIHAPSAGMIKIIPAVMGARKSGVGQIFSAIVIAVASYYTGGALGSAGYAGAGSAVANAGYGMALSMALGGVAQLITGTPKTTETDKNASTVFNGAVNVSAQGNPVPIGYGRRIVGSAVISAGISVVQEGKAGGNYNEILGIHAKPPGAVAPTVAWNKEARRWEEMDGTGLYLNPNYMDRVYDSTYWRNYDQKAPYLDATLDRWELPDARVTAIWNGRFGLWCLNTGGADGGPCMTFDPVEKHYTILTSEEMNTMFPPADPNYAG